jgi:hypothetical protein
VTAFKAAARRVARCGLAVTDRALASAVPIAARAQYRDQLALFIVGAPRSGTTVIYQTLVAFRRFAYLNNVIARFPRSAPLVARFLQVQRWPTPRSLESTYGDTPGLNGPSEGGDFWDYVFPWSEHHAVDPDETDPGRIARLRATVCGLSAVYRAPFLAKNTWHSFRLAALQDALPRALFLIVTRDPILVAQSMLRNRRDRIGDAREPFAVRPPEMLAMGSLASVDHVAYQIVFTLEAIARARRQLGVERFLTLDYVDFCRNPARALESIDAFCLTHGVALQHRDVAPPHPLEVRQDVTLAPEELERFRQIFRERGVLD